MTIRPSILFSDMSMSEMQRLIQSRLFEWSPRGSARQHTNGERIHCHADTVLCQSKRKMPEIFDLKDEIKDRQLKTIDIQ